MSLEARITEDRVSYISRIEIDRSRNTIMVEFVTSSENATPDRRLHFSDVHGLSVTDFEDDEDCLDSLVGLDEYQTDGSVKFVIHTEKQELIFRTSVDPQIERLQ